MDLSFMSALDWAIVSVYLLVTLAASLYYHRFARASTEEYFVAGRKAPWWLVGTSAFGFIYAPDGAVIDAAWAYQTGIRGVAALHGVCCAAGFGIYAKLFAPFWRRLKIITDAEFSGVRYEGSGARAARVVHALYMVILTLTILAWQGAAVGKTASVLWGVGYESAIVAFALLAGAYTIAAGIWGVMVSDFVQFLTFMVGGTSMLFVAVSQAGGFATVAGALPTRHLDFWGGEQAAVWPLALLIILTIQQIIGNPWVGGLNGGGGMLAQRTFAAKDERHAQGGMLLGGVLNGARLIIWIGVGLTAIVLFPGIEDPELIWGSTIRLMPAGVLGLMMAAVMAAFMSSWDTNFNTGASYLINDVYSLLKPGESETHYVRMSYVSTLVLMIAGVAIALGIGDVGAFLVFVVSVLVGPVMPVMLLRWIWWRMTGWGQVAGVVGGVIVGTLLKLLLPGVSDILIYLYSLPWGVLSAVVVSLLDKPVADEKIVSFYENVRPFGWWVPVRAKSAEYRYESSSGL